MNIACIVPTYQGRRDLERLLISLEEQTIDYDAFVVDSSSTDGTDKLAIIHGVDVVSIYKSEFNHGRTRQLMVDKYPDYDVYIFLTQDAYLADKQALSNLVKPFSDSTVGVICGRQLPHSDAKVFGKHSRLFNYPAESSVKSIDDAARLGIKTAFISNSFAAYRREALLDVGGFPKRVIMSEDMYVAARMLLHGWKVVYNADACVYHSHNYSIKEEFKRYFDIGVFQGREPWIREEFGKSGGEGLRYVLSELRFLGWHHWYLLPALIIRNASKYLGYRLGLQERKLPLWMKRKISMDVKFWEDSKVE